MWLWSNFACCNIMPIRVIIFDDNSARRQSLSYLLAMYEDIVLAAVYEDAHDAVDKVQKANAEVVLMDIDMPGVNGIEAVKLIKAKMPEVDILMQTVLDDEDTIFEAIKAGASGYIVKRCPPEKIIEGIREAKEGGAPMSPSIAAKVLSFFRNAPSGILTASKEPAKDYLLTPKEKQILKSLVEGNNYKMVAAQMNVSYNTVNTHVKHIYNKLHVHSLGEAVAKAINERLV